MPTHSTISGHHALTGLSIRQTFRHAFSYNLGTPTTALWKCRNHHVHSKEMKHPIYCSSLSLYLSSHHSITFTIIPSVKHWQTKYRQFEMNFIGRNRPKPENRQYFEIYWLQNDFRLFKQSVRALGLEPPLLGIAVSTDNEEQK